MAASERLKFRLKQKLSKTGSSNLKYKCLRTFFQPHLPKVSSASFSYRCQAVHPLSAIKATSKADVLASSLPDGISAPAPCGEYLAARLCAETTGKKASSGQIGFRGGDIWYGCARWPVAQTDARF